MDSESGIRKNPFLDPGPGGQKGTGARVRIRNTAWRIYWSTAVEPHHFDEQQDPDPH